MKQTLVTTSWDDGHKLDLRLAALLRKYKIAATFYIAPQDHEFAAADLLTGSDTIDLAQDFEIGAHTITHPRLTEVDDKTARHEITASKKYLEKLLGRPITSFCYPGGAYTDDHIGMVHKAGFKLARTVERFHFNKTDNYELATTIHAYRHWSDVWPIFKTARYNPFRFLKFLWQWDALAIYMFDQAMQNRSVFHLWGHSWEIDKNKDWDRLERVLQHIDANRKHVKLVTNAELVEQKQRKVLFASAYFAPRVGGLERYEEEMAKGLLAAGCDVTVITSGRGKRVEKEEQPNGLVIYRLPTQLSLANTPIGFNWYWQIKRIIAAEQPDIINAHAPVPYLPDLAVLAAGNRPCIVTYHSGTMKKNIFTLDVIIGFYEKFMLTYMLRKAEHIISTSEVTSRNFLSKYQGKMSVITPGVDVQQFTLRKHPPVKPRVLFVGNFEQPWKGLDYLKAAVSELKDVDLVVVGNGPQIPMKHVTYKGVLHGQLLVREIHRSSVAVLPSTNPSESFGMVLIEAMACGVPVIGSNIGGIPNVIDDHKTGLLVPPADVPTLTYALRKILTDPDYADKLAKAGYNKVITQFTWELSVHRLKMLMEEIW